MKTPPQTPRQPALLLAAFLTSLCVFAARPAAAATEVWNGGAVPDGNWQTPGNWNGVTPATNDLLIFTGGTQTKTTNNFAAGTAFGNISFNNSASSFTAGGNAIVLASPTDAGSGLIANGNIGSASASAESIKMPVVLASGLHTLSTSGAGTLNLNGSITHSNGAVAVFSGHVNVTGGLSTLGNSYGILGGWAALASGDWASLDASSNIVAYASYVTNLAGSVIANNPAANVKIPQSGTAVTVNSGVTTINSLVFGNGAASTSSGNQALNIGAGNTLVLGQNGGIFNSTSLGQATSARTLTIGASIAAGGTLTAGDGVNPAQITLGDTAISPSGTYVGVITINSIITDNNLLGKNAPVSVTMAGSYFSINGGGNAATTNTYSGGTYILQGRCSQPGRFTFGTGPVYIVPGGQANCGCQITNDFYIAGSGSVESGGMGALRLYSASLANGYTGNLPGTIHLMGTANICADNISVASQLIGLSGKITGPGGLGIGSPTATSRSGVINLGSTNGATDIPNDYAGNTTINGITAGTVSSILEICNPADNNIMPHGATGSYAGGPTGNLILNGVAASRQAIFELNGSMQTINGLVSTATSPANDIVQDTTGGGSLVVGDNNATTTFGGIIQSALPVTKIGTGTLTLSGANTYTGNTTVSNGTLATTTLSTGAGNYTVASGAALGVTAATAGGTLQVNNLTFGTSSAALRLSAGTNGDPVAAIVNVAGALTLNGNVSISLSGVGLTAGGPFTVLTYAPGSRTGAGAFVLNNSPRVVATLNDDKVNGIVSMTIISADTAVKWKGGLTGGWDISDSTNSIWQTVPSGNTTYYIESGSGNDSVLFDDSLTGTPNVNLTTNLTPQAITVSNSVASYLFAGPGRIDGTTGLTKNGTNQLIIANSGNNSFSGPIALNAGTLVISNNSVIANTLSGGGSLVKTGNGTLVLSGDGSAFNGPVSVNGGILSVQNGASLATAARTTVSSGAALDIANNNVGLGFEPITVSGSGVGGNGAIVNSSGYGFGAIATSFQTLTMAGDTTIGGPGRLDFRSTDPNGGADATLSTGGNAYNLTKVSGSVLQLASVQIDNALANINVQGGTLGLQGNLPSLGNPASTLTVSGGAILQLNSVSSTMNKVLVLNDGANVNNTGGANIYGGLVTLLGNEFFNVAGSSLTFTNTISGPGSLSKVTGTSLLSLTATNTYTGNTLVGAGTLQLIEPADIRSSAAITIGVGATLDMTGRNDQTLTVLGGHSLTGGGFLSGNLTNLPGSTLAVGTPAAVGSFTIYQNVSLNGTTTMKLAEATLASDLLSVYGNLNYDGTLVLTNLTGTLKGGDSFQLFNASSYSGSFSSIVPATPGLGLAWNTNSLSSGTLSVSQLLAITSFTLAGTSLDIQGAGGAAYGNFTLLTTTNLALPLAQWTPFATSTFDGNGNFDFTTNINASLPAQFYKLSQ